MSGIIGHKDRIGLLGNRHMSNFVSQSTDYTHPSLNIHYSIHGFALPINNVSRTLKLHLDNSVPIPSLPHLKIKLVDSRFVLVDHSGKLWKIGLDGEDKDDKDQYTSSYTEIYNELEGWWAELPGMDIDSNTANMLLGFLYTNPSEKKLEEFVYRRLGGWNITWLNIPDIVKELNERYPKEKKD